ncbi:MAG TPA: PH domain-containing protein [Chitinophagaceae bacterium]|nr:PH domain-containing protein [Chitinophagaceae bacterium]
MWTKEALETFMKDFGFKPSMTKPEIKELPSLLSPDEKLHGLLEGMLKRVHNNDINGNGLVIATNKRIIFFRKSIIGTVTKEEIPISKVSSASFRKGLMFASVAVITASNEAVVEQCDKTLANRFSQVVQKLISDLGTPFGQTAAPQPVNGATNGAPDLSLQLEKLFELKQKGILTEDEFSAQKAKLLGL